MKVLKFGAVWCNGCVVMKPRWGQLEKEFPWLQTEFYDYDRDKDMVRKYNVTDELPMVVFLDKQGNEFLRISGEISKEKIVEIILANKDK
ncbi:MAG: thioredoxin family protein [Candidatus Woesebacteria bacterium]|jgi:thiol-disulfide isomerase/thioredoxin